LQFGRVTSMSLQHLDVGTNMPSGKTDAPPNEGAREKSVIE
jgi:hypothetical protein